MSGGEVVSRPGDWRPNFRTYQPVKDLPAVNHKEELQSVLDLMHKLLTKGDLKYAHERVFAKSIQKIAEIVKERL